eukprot:1353002-Amorphochlora_amoeboformis.AAC.1
MERQKLSEWNQYEIERERPPRGSPKSPINEYYIAPGNKHNGGFGHPQTHNNPPPPPRRAPDTKRRNYMKGVLLPLVLICSAATCLFSASNVKMMRARPVGRMRFFPKIVNFAKLRPQAGIRSVRKGGGIPSMRHEIGGG